LAKAAWLVCRSRVSCLPVSSSENGIILGELAKVREMGFLVQIASKKKDRLIYWAVHIR